MRAAGGKLADDLGRRDKGDLDAGQSGDRATIVARAAPLDEFEAGAGEERRGALLQSSLGGDGEDERPFGAVAGKAAHQRVSPVREPVEGDRGADGGNVRTCAEPPREPVVASAGERGLRARGHGIVRLEHEAGVIVEVAHEGGAEADILDSRPPGGDEAVAHARTRRAPRRGRAWRNRRRRRSSIAAASGSPEIARKASQHRPLLGCDRLARPQRGLLEEPVGDLARAAPADRLDAGDRQQILDERLGAGVVGAFQRRQHAGLRERALARPVEDGVKAAPARDAAAQTAAPDLREPRANRARCRTGPRRRAARRARRRPPPSPPQGEREDFGVGRFGVLAAEALEPGLRLLSALPRSRAEHRAEIGIFGDAAGLVRSEIGAADRNCIFRPQAQLLARGVGGEEQAAANLLARHVEKDRRRMQDRRLGPLEAGGEEMIERALAGAARRLTHGIGEGRRFNGRGHRMALKSLERPL